MCFSEIRKEAPSNLVRSCNCYFWSIILESSYPFQIKADKFHWDWSSWHPTSDFFRPALLITSRRRDGPRGSYHRQPYQPSRSIQTHRFVMTILFIHLPWSYDHSYYAHNILLQHIITYIYTWLHDLISIQKIYIYIYAYIHIYIYICACAHPIIRGIFHQAQRAETAALFLRATSWYARVIMDGYRPHQWWMPRNDGYLGCSWILHHRFYSSN